MSKNREFLGVWIPRDLWLNKELSLQEKCFFIEIQSLDNEQHCWANNQYFADFFNLSKGRVSQVLRSLTQKGYIKVDVYEDSGNKRTIQTLMTYVLKKPKEGSLGYDYTSLGYDYTSKQKLKHSNISSNTVSNTTDNIKTSQNNSIPSSPGNSKVNTKSADVKIGNFPPLPAEVVKYADSIDFKLDGETFCDYYASQGWKKANGRPLKDWQAAVRTWKRNDDSRKPDGPSEYTSEESRRVLFDSYIADGTLPPDTNYEQWSEQRPT